MKNLFLLLLLSLAVVACKKGTDDETDGGTGNFTISGVTDADLTTNTSASFTFPITVAAGTGASESVTLRVDNLPRGVHARIEPSSGTPPFAAQVNLWNDFSGTGGTYPINLVGNAVSGSKTYKMNVTLDYYRGWKFGDSVYNMRGLYKDPGGPTRYPQIRVLGGGAGLLTISFSVGKALPTTTRSYKITGSSSAADDIQITMIDGPYSYSATGVGAPTGKFTFDSLGRFIFKCANVEMSNGLDKKMLDCSIVE